MTTKKQIDDFLALKRIAFVGVSHNPKEFSYALWQEFRQRRYEAIPVNPNVAVLDGQTCLQTGPGHRARRRGRADHDLVEGHRADRPRLRRGRREARLDVQAASPPAQ